MWGRLMSAEEYIDRIAELERLAASDPMEYEVARVEAAKRLGVRAPVLDRLVTAKRRALGIQRADEGEGQGRAVKIEDVLPWHEAVDGDMLASTLVAAVKTYMVLSDAAADAISLWALHTWVVNEFTISPRLAVTSPTKGCGKTTVLRFLNKVVRRPKRTGSISPPALFRVVEQHQPTILLDETEKYIEHGSDLHALLNEGHCKGGTVMRVLGDKLELREFAVFGAVAFARNGRLPDDLEQRSIVIEMQRRRPEEELAELREDRCEALQTIARMCTRWAEDIDLRDYDPEMAGLINRTADNWRPLLAIADAIGGDWPERARKAAAALAQRESEATGTMLLADTKAVFEEKDTDRLASADICEALNAMEGRPWADWKGRTLTPNQLAKLLRPFGVVTMTAIRIGSRTLRGYYRNQFKELWQRYLPAQGVPEVQPCNNADEMGTSCTIQSATPESDVAFQKCEKVACNEHCCTVALPEGGERICGHCRGPGTDSDTLLEVAIDGRTVHLHRRCMDGYAAVDIPPFLDRRGVVRA
jgi:Protein of unknown function (DUF3631)